MTKPRKPGKTGSSDVSSKAPVDFIGIGAAKAATSWLARCLAEHPDICIPPEKELHFFSTARHYKKGLPYYAKFFSACQNAHSRGEFSTTYLSSDEAPERIREQVPDAKLLVVLRNPYERALSHLQHLISQKKLSKNTSMREAMRAFPAIRKEGEYANLLKRWFRLFPREQFLMVFVDDIKADPNREIGRVYEFLGVRTDFSPPSLYVKYNTSRIRSFRLFKPANKVYRKIKKRIWGRFVLNIVRQFNVFLWANKLVASLPSQHQRQAAIRETKELLAQYYERDIAKLEKLLCKDLTAWKI